MNDLAVPIDQPSATERDPTIRWFWFLIASHILLWTLVPILTQPNAPLDAVEMLYWGDQWEWGYYKHPPLPAWLAELASSLMGDAQWPTYLLSQVCVAACLWAAWRMGRELLSPWSALCGAVLLEACYYYNYTTPEFNHNMTLRACWAVATLFLYWAVVSGKNRHWIAFGLATALGMYAKYQMVFLLAAMIAFSFWAPAARRRWRTAGPYLAVAISLALFAPHLWWAWRHDFPTLEYAMNRTQGEGAWTDHLVNPLNFLAAQMLAIGPLLLLSVPLVGWRGRLRKLSEDQAFSRDFLLAVVLGPLALIVLLAIVKGAHVRSMLGAPLFTFAGVLLLHLRQKDEAPVAYRRLLGGCAALSVVFAAALAARNVTGPYVRGEVSRVHFPAERLAREVERRWRVRHSGHVPIVGGSWWTAANAAFYLPGQPDVYGDLDPKESPWLSDERLRQQGGVIVWPLHAHSEPFVRHLRRRFPSLHMQPPIVLRYDTGAETPPLRVAMAIVEPARSQRIASAADPPPRRRKSRAYR